MIRKLILPAVAVALLGGCMTGGYSYRQDHGDYYYGQPGVDYRYHGSPYGYPSYRYGYPGYSPYSYYGYGGFGYYGNPYRPYPGYPYHPYQFRPRPPVVVRPPTPDDDAPPPPPRTDGRRPPWRDLDNLGRRLQGEPPRSQPLPVVQTPPPARPAPRAAGSRNQQIMRRAQEESRKREIE